MKPDHIPKSDATAPITRGRFLMIGRRKDAIIAASRLGFEPVVIDVPARGEQAGGAFGGSAQWAIDAASKLFPDAPPVGVAAVATGSVCAAAAVRHLFGLSGITRETALRCHDKLVMKKAIAAAGIPCAPWRETTANTTVEELTDALGLPLVLKMPISSGGRGVWICQTPGEVADRLRPGLLAEGFVAGIEMSVETLRHDNATIFHNPTCYLEPRWANVVPAELEAAQAIVIADLSDRVHEALGITDGISHMEIFLTDTGPVFGEIAARPPGGYIMELLRRAYGFDPWEAVVKLACGDLPAVGKVAEKVVGVWLIHPGAGEVIGICGRRKALAINEIVDVSCRLSAGDLIKPRVGSGESKGRLIAEAQSQQACAAALQKAAETVQITLANTKFAQC